MSWSATRFKDELARNNRKTLREGTSTHHRRCRSNGGTNEPRNLSELTRTKHTSWHNLFYNFTPERIAEEINARYIDPDWAFIVVKRGD